jgi:hypothetical protein
MESLVATLIIALVFGLMLFKPSISASEYYFFVYYYWGKTRKEVIIKR